MSGLHVERAPAGSAPSRAEVPLVLVHGWAMNAATWGEFGETLARRRDVYRLELPGHGRSPWEGLDDLRGWVEAARAVVPWPAVWLGWSLGALLALRLALDHPEAVRGVVVLAGTPRFLQDSDWPHAMAPEVLARFGAGLTVDPAATIERFLTLQVRGARDSGPTLRRLKAAIRAVPAPHPEALAVGLELLRATDLRRELALLEAPVLWLLGERDTLVPVAVGRHLCAWLPQVCLEVVDGAGHAPFVSHGPKVAERVRSFLEGLGG
jgi:pimeloyl-[acyl-carrier protein] methyl ester esterase